MAELKGSKTHQHLKDAFAGESQANRRYLYFANKADIEGYPEVANLLGIPLKGKRVTHMDIWIIFLRLEIQQLIYQLVLQKIISPLRLQVKHMNIPTCTQVWQRMLVMKDLMKLLIGLRH